MTQNVRPPRATSAKLGQDAYVYALARVNDYIAAITSNDTLYQLDPATLKVKGSSTGIHRGVTCLATDHISTTNAATTRRCFTAGRDGVVKTWDGRSVDGQVICTVDNGQGFSALATTGNLLVAGTESTKEGAGDVSVFVWDLRKPSLPLRTYLESHNDTITALQFHPSNPSLFLSASTDALITLFDTNQAEEDDAVQQVFNHSAAVHCASFVSDTEVMAVSSDEQMSIYQISNEAERENEDVAAVQTVLGDVRGSLDCSYVVDLVTHGATPWVVYGNLEKQSLGVTPLARASGDRPTEYVLDRTNEWQFSGAHGEEVVRDVLLDTANGQLYSCGEDGVVKLWDMPSSTVISEGTEEMDIDEVGDGGDGTEEKRRHRTGKEKRQKKQEKKKAALFNPY